MERRCRLGSEVTSLSLSRSSSSDKSDPLDNLNLNFRLTSSMKWDPSCYYLKTTTNRKPPHAPHISSCICLISQSLFLFNSLLWIYTCIKIFLVVSSSKTVSFVKPTVYSIQENSKKNTWFHVCQSLLGILDSTSVLCYKLWLLG